MNSCLLSVQSLSKSFNKFIAVQDVSFSVNKGDVLGIIGRNGAGKTTLLRLICRLMYPTSGTVIIDGKNLNSNFSEAIKNVGALIETPACYGHLTAYENLLLSAKLLGIDKAQIEETLQIVELQDAGKKKVKHFSLGMKQRLGIANAILANPPLLILDEPTNGLDPQGIIDMRGLILSLKERGFTILIASHLLSEVEQLCTRVILLDNGKIVRTGSLDELLESNYSTGWEYEIDLKSIISLEEWQRLFPQVQVIRQNNSRLHISLKTDEISEILYKLIINGHLVKEVVHINKNLEQVFLKCSGGQ